MLIKVKKKALAIIILIAVAINVVTFCLAFPQTFTPETSYLARDFSAYYIGEWRLFHNPTQIYQQGSVPGDYPILPNPQTFKYTPSFLILMAPSLTLSYQNAFTAFNIMQVVLFPALAFFVYKLLKDKNFAIAAVAAVIILVAPLPALPINQAAIDMLRYRFTSLNPQSISPNFYASYILGNAHALQTILLVGALYFGFTKKPWLSALLFAFGAFDPRIGLFALPLLVWYNRQKLLQFTLGAVGFLAATNLPFFFYNNIGFTFLRTETNGFVVSQMYPYDWLPFYAILTLMIVEILSVAISHKKIFLTAKNKVNAN